MKNDIQENINTVYPIDKYKEESVFTKEQQHIFHNTLSGSCTLLLELCLTAPHQVKKIVYLADDMLEIAKSIPSYLNKKVLIDMRTLVCDVVQQIARYAAKVEAGLSVNIDEQIKHVRDTYS